MERFTVTEDHVKLLSRAFVDWDSCEFGAPQIDPKRPYGNSNVLNDIGEILGWTKGDEWDGYICFSRAQEEVARNLHRQTAKALQIFLRVGKLEAGEYVADDYQSNWRKLA